MSEVVSYIRGLPLPAAPSRSRAAPGDVPPAPPTFTSTDQAVTIRAQMAEFSAAVPQAIRPAVSNGLLLGMLAADKATEGNSDPVAYFTAFNSVMKQIGWSVTQSGLNEQSISEQNAELHKAIIPIVTAIFGSGATTASIIISVLKGLEAMNQDAPWITVFEQKSNKAKATNFGLSYVDAGAGGGASVKTACFSLTAHSKLTQVLFFKFSSSGAKLKSGSCQMDLGPQMIETTGAELETKVAPFILDNIKNIDV